MRERYPAAAQAPGCAGYGTFLLICLWVIFVCFAFQVTAWSTDQLFSATQGTPMLPETWLAITWAQGVALALVLVPAALLSGGSNLRHAYRLWLAALVLFFVFGLTRLLPLSAKQAATLSLAILALLGALLLARLGRRPPEAPAGPRFLWAVAPLSALLFLPWALFGALGSPVDTLLGALAGYAFGLCAALLLTRFLFAPPGAAPDERVGVRFGGIVAGVALLIMASSFGFGGLQLLLIFALPPLGFALATLARHAASASAAWPSLAVVIGSAVAGPLLFFDPAELQLILGEGEVPAWATQATVMALILAWLLGILLRAGGSRLAAPLQGGQARLLGLSAAAALAVAYFGFGQPGFWGDQFFVIMKEQSDLSAASAMADRTERVRFVYTTLTSSAQNSQAGIRELLTNLRVPHRSYYLVNALEVDGGPLLRAYLAARPEVARVLDNPRLRPLPEALPQARGAEAPPNGPTWNVVAAGADRVWREFGVTGQGIVVGQSDSGVQGDHPALAPGYRGRDGQHDYNWLDPWSQSPLPNDISGHGTHTLGSVVGRGGIGLAPDAEWFACVNLERNLANPARYLDCMQFMLAPYPQQGDAWRDGDPARAAHVMNNSWGCPPLEGCDPDSLRTATAALRAAGIFVVTSAGNEGPDCGSVSDPIAIYAEAFAVGAIDRDGNLASFSSRGPVQVDGSNRIKPDIVAPGVDVPSSYPGSTYYSASGTSMAGPQVAGVVALLWSAQPRLIGDIPATERLLRETARPYTGSQTGCFSTARPSPAYGYGVVDAYAAVQAALAQ
ncbi:MAG: S8 family serine peptidase [Chloroflexota bacterium]